VKYTGSQKLNYQTAGSAGIDLVATTDAYIRSGDVARVYTESSFEIPSGCVGLVRGRSGLAFKHGIWCFEGTIDSDYRGALQVLLANVGRKDYAIRAGDRVAQLVVVPYVRAELEQVSRLEAETERGAAGFGSTGH
jgi:dUTP pyrophosphatase